MDNNKKLKEQTALVTGASSGIGKAVAIALASEGAKVVINYSSHPERAEEVVAEIKANGGTAMIYGADVSKEDEVQAMFQAMFKEYGTIDILVSNSGIQKDSSFAEMILADWQRVIDVNLTGQFLCAREAVKEFLKRGVVPERSAAAGKIICMSSVHEVIPWAGHANYAASKGGVMLMMKSMAQELAPHKIRINSIAPGAIQTPINKEAWETQEALDKLLTLIPYKRIGKPEDIGKVAVWLASDESDYVVGTTIFVDGGMTLYPAFASNG
ncbi:SDR family oxidoreductase [Segetibacter sp.]|uniref:SDR family oxidoreductase n=1 Tax=Segetibacter sp. TaxID=2231182 RepID=UPI00261DDB78|nr:SDR family oxidoreductase [Segetibacter sp.]MCW3079544.1 glucose 1-dehydrogenase [Segetibacter sp.]